MMNRSITRALFCFVDNVDECKVWLGTRICVCASYGLNIRIIDTIGHGIINRILCLTNYLRRITHTLRLYLIVIRSKAKKKLFLFI